MSDTPATTAAPPADSPPDMKLFWACFIALIATAFGFIIRAFLMGTWAEQYGFTETQKGQIFGVGLWPFAISIVLFSLIIDRIGYGKAMVFAFVTHIASAVLTILVPTFAGNGVAEGETFNSTAYNLLYLANFIVALGNGTIEAVVNPVVATMFARDKTKWLNILHAGWPGGLVLAGTITLIAAGIEDWRIKVALMFLPVLAYGILMLGAKFPVSERVASGVSYKEMLGEFGMGGALIVSYLMFSEIFRVFGLPEIAVYIAMAVATIGFGAAVNFAIGRPLFLLLLLIMIPLASTELGVDSWIEDLMKKPVGELGIESGWVLVYTSLIMMVLRFFAGPIVHKISPLGLLAVSSVLAIIGLFSLSAATGVAILLAATIYAFGKTFFWPTMLGVVAEQFPRGGALTLNAAGGVGMLGVGVVGAQILGFWVDKGVAEEFTAQYPEAAETAVVDKDWGFGAIAPLKAVEPSMVENAEAEAALETLTEEEKKETLATVTIFPFIMLACYLGLIAYFKTRGGYQAEVIRSDDGEVEAVVEHTPADPVPAGVSEEQFTGGVDGPAGH